MTTLEFRAADAFAGPAPQLLARVHTRETSPPEPDPALWRAPDLDRALSLLGAQPHSPSAEAQRERPNSGRLSLAMVQALSKGHGWQAESADLSDGATPGRPIILPTEDGTGFVVVLRRRGDAVTLLLPDARRMKRKLAAVEWLLAAPRADLRHDIAALDIPSYLKDRLRRAMRPAPGGYRLARVPNARLSGELKSSGLPRLGLLLVGLLVIAQALDVGGWAIFGGAVLGGGRDLWGVTGWLLLLSTLHLTAMPIQRVQSELSLRAGMVIKRRLQRGALRLDPDHLRRLGPSALTSRSIEAQALEQSGLAALLMSLTAIVELATAALVCVAGAAGPVHLAWMAGLLAAIAAAAIPYSRALSRWTKERRDQASRLVDCIAGHRSMRLQLHPLRRRDRTDDELASYVHLSRRADKWARWMLLGLPSLWTMGSVATLIPGALSRELGTAGVAVTIGATLLGARALNTMVGSLAATFRARLAWLQLADLLAAADAGPEPQMPTASHTGSHRLVDLSFRHPDRKSDILDRVTMEFGTREKILLTGASGSGKSTLGALLTGLRTPSAGRVVLGGQSGLLPSIAAPQAQENHIFSATLVENLFLARIGPLDPADEARALDVLDRLQLGSLMARMPLGLFQRLGNGGWALSQGEKSRICVARALLANADLILLDESFGPLDPDTARTCLGVARDLSRTLVVVAHP